MRADDGQGSSTHPLNSMKHQYEHHHQANHYISVVLSSHDESDHDRNSLSLAFTISPWYLESRQPHEADYRHCLRTGGCTGVHAGHRYGVR